MAKVSNKEVAICARAKLSQNCPKVSTMEQGGGDMRPSKVWERAAPLPDRDFAIPCYRLRPPYNVFQLRTSWVPIFLSFVSSSLSLNGRFIIISRLIC